MKMKRYFIFIIFCLVLSGCTNSKSEEIRWFNTKNDAIQYGLKEEGISKKDIISRYDIDGELFLVYKKEEGSKLLVGLSNIANKNNKYSWYRNDAYVEVKGNIQISLITKALSGNEFNFYTGITKEKELTIKTELGDISPHIDEKSGIYNFISLVN